MALYSLTQFISVLVLYTVSPQRPGPEQVPAVQLGARQILEHVMRPQALALPLPPNQAVGLTQDGSTGHGAGRTVGPQKWQPYHVLATCP